MVRYQYPGRGRGSGRFKTIPEAFKHGRRGRAPPPPPVSKLAVPVIVDRGAESSGASVNGTFRARVRRAVRRPGKCEESDNQETGLCVVTLRASKWLPTTIYRRTRYTFTDTVRERDTVEEGIGWNEIKLGLSCPSH